MHEKIFDIQKMSKGANLEIKILLYESHQIAG